MPEEAHVNEDSKREERTFPRRVLVISDEGADALRDNLSLADFETERATADDFARHIEEFAPSVILIAFGNREGEGRLVALARRLRSNPATFALPIVFLFRDEGRTLRSAALHAGADDYFAQSATREELRARLEALLWRVEAGRRAAPIIAEQRDEIDNFIFLLDAVAADARLGMTGALALVEAHRNTDGIAGATGSLHSSTADDGRALTQAHGFLKLNLRRVDAVAFYGPATLLIYLPGADADAAHSTLAALREEFSEMSRDGDLSIGISSFPAHGAEVEQLVEQAGAALEKARAVNSRVRVFVYGSEGAIYAFASDAGRRATAGVIKRRTGALQDNSAARSLATAEQIISGHGASNSRVAAATQTGERRAGGKIRRLMLVVSEAARMAQVNLLMRSAGYEVRAAFDGQHALNLLRIDRPDLLVVDYELHGMDGVEMLKRLAKQSGTNAPPPALMLVPAEREDIRREASDAGARGIVQMPYDPVELLDMLGSLIEV